ncbi:RHS repeat-associated core domain-containing protein [Niabella sp.]|uniref:RHS repeat domain-containing protein n=1 Tax=Niabella sp. TaxID=1962976 RepID=UPI00262475AE|nr:RHS repeat-associated core domain-containing protein [Niabella sp.]
MQRVAMEEGRFRSNGTVFTVDYFLKDHLGNVRSMINEDKTLLEETHYYPFGLTMKGISTQAATVSLQNKELYNGKELQNDLELDSYDYGARMYNAQIGRWFQPDPSSENYLGTTPYNYTLNNPISLFDLDGKDAIITIMTDKNGRIIINVTSTIYISHGSEEERDEYASEATKFYRNQKNAYLFHNNDKNISININLTFENIDKLKGGKIGDGNNELSLEYVHSGKRGGRSQVNGTPIPILGENGERTGRFEDEYITGNFGWLNPESMGTKGTTTIHETFHFLGVVR